MSSSSSQRWPLGSQLLDDGLDVHHVPGHHRVVQHRQAAEGVQLIAELPPPQRPFLAEA
jgi:hypothetical protein